MMYQVNTPKEVDRWAHVHYKYDHMYDKYDRYIESDEDACENSSTWDNLIAWGKNLGNCRFRADGPYYNEEDTEDLDGVFRHPEEMLLTDFQLRLRPLTATLEDDAEVGTSYVVNCYEGYFMLDQENSRAAFITTTLPGLLEWLKGRERIEGGCENGGKPYYPHNLQSYKGYKGQIDSGILLTRKRHRLRGKVDSVLRMEDYKNVSSWDDIIKRVDLAHYVALIYEGEWEGSIAAVLLENFVIHYRPNTEILFGTRAHDFIVYCEEGVFSINKSKQWACLISRTLPGALSYLGFEEADPEGEDKESGKPYFE